MTRRTTYLSEVAVPGYGVCHDGRMSERSLPKMEGRKVPTKMRLTPEQYAWANEEADRYGVSMAAMIGAAIDHAAGRPSLLDAAAPDSIDFNDQEGTASSA